MTHTTEPPENPGRFTLYSDDKSVVWEELVNTDEVQEAS